uniref:RNA-directed DNA polymerase n=1 Tax=Tanacetum cinerariifolium TaxID=118510 RepID=A0A6L2N0Q3_TANCI|nr:RNA-directed DNA polymerase [Tanacetum cinerariifolium]
MQIRVQGFDLFRGLYYDDPDFKEIWSKFDNGPFRQFSKLDGYLFKGARLFIPLCSLREAIILKGHAGGLAGHFGRDKTLAILRELFYWPKMERGVNRLLERCRTCHIAKTHSSNAGLYTPLYVPVAEWKDVSLDFVLAKAKKDEPKEAREAPKEWTVEEEIVLCQGWCDVSENNISGNSMKAKGFLETVISNEAVEEETQKFRPMGRDRAKAKKKAASSSRGQRRSQ